MLISFDVKNYPFVSYPISRGIGQPYFIKISPLRLSAYFIPSFKWFARIGVDLIKLNECLSANNIHFSK